MVLVEVVGSLKRLTVLWLQHLPAFACIFAVPSGVSVLPPLIPALPSSSPPPPPPQQKITSVKRIQGRGMFSPLA